MKKNSFIKARVSQLAPDELGFIKQTPRTITSLDDGHSLRPLFETLAGDPAMADRYFMAFDEAVNRINLTFRVREMTTHGMMR